MVQTTQGLANFVQSEFRKRANPNKAKAMAAYMKTKMPFYGIQKPDRVPVFREMKRQFAPRSRREYESAVRVLWNLPHREEKYAAVEYAVQHKPLITSASLPLYEELIRQGAWWDFVDAVAMLLVGRVLLEEPKPMRPILERWIDDPDLWIRRSAIICHNRLKGHTDRKQLFDFCLRRADESEFFIRKAIGWALRQYSYTEPMAVREFLLHNRDRLSGLSFREGARQLVRTGVMNA